MEELESDIGSTISSDEEDKLEELESDIGSTISSDEDIILEELESDKGNTSSNDEETILEELESDKGNTISSDDDNIFEESKSDKGSTISSDEEDNKLDESKSDKGSIKCNNEEDRMKKLETDKINTPYVGKEEIIVDSSIEAKKGELYDKYISEPHMENNTDIKNNLIKTEVKEINILPDGFKVDKVNIDIPQIVNVKKDQIKLDNPLLGPVHTQQGEIITIPASSNTVGISVDSDMSLDNALPNEAIYDPNNKNKFSNNQYNGNNDKSQSNERRDIEKTDKTAECESNGKTNNVSSRSQDNEDNIKYKVGVPSVITAIGVSIGGVFQYMKVKKEKGNVMRLRRINNESNF